jgi:hypothetical protein
MKKLPYILTVAIILMTGCNTKKLDQKTATELIKKEYQYPRVLDYDIFCSDPEHARNILKAGLEEKGLVIVQRTQKLKDIGKPLIQFTEAARPYFLPTSKEDKESYIQKVKIADEVFDAIKTVTIGSSGNKAIVEYTAIRNNTVFASLLKKGLSRVKEHKAYFLLTENGWQIVKKSDVEFIAF